MHQRSPKTATALVVLLAFSLSGCETVMDNPKAIIGGATGAAAGGLIGHAAGGGDAGIVGGVLLGGLLGGAIGNALDQRDKELAYNQQQRAFEYGKTSETTSWHNPDTGHSGTYTPTRTYQSQTGQYCREYSETVTIDGQRREAYGTACRQPDGSWKIGR